MALQIINSTINNANSVGVNLGIADSVIVVDFGTAASSGSYAGIAGAGSNHWVRIEGNAAGTFGISLGDLNTFDNANKVLVGEGGLVMGTTTAVVMTSYNASVVNFGLIDGGVGVSFNGASASGVSRVDNSGTILGVSSGVAGGANEAIHVLNRGLISGGNASILGSSLGDTVRNRGELAGRVDLQGGNDLYNGRGGFIEDSIQGGAGNDTFLPGAGDEIIDGGLDFDLLDFRKETSVRVALDNSHAGTGAAKGDTYANIENLYGSSFGNDSLTGNTFNNVISGFGGKDTINGGDGFDSIGGGAGADVLTGGTGNDTFYFNSLADGGDTITDFGGVAGDDLLYISASGFGGGLVSGAVVSASQFQSRTDNAAQDADDRFIYNTTTNKLYFDVNGNGAGGLTLIATFQAGATVTNVDLFLNA